MTDLGTPGASTPGSGRWVRVSKGSLGRISLILAGGSAVIALAIAVPMTQLFGVALGVVPPFWLGWAAGTVVVFILIGMVLLPRASRSLEVDRDGTALRIGRRIVPASGVRAAYRVPDPVHDGRFQLQLAVPGLDALVGISTVPPVELPAEALDALLRFVHRAPIEPDAAWPTRPPLAGELGPRDPAQQAADRLDRALLPFETFAYTRASLLAELELARDAATGAPIADQTVRDLGLVQPGSTNAPELQATVRQVEQAQAAATGKRGFFHLLGGRYRQGLDAAEAWVRGIQPSFTGRRGPAWGWGLAILLVALVGPWVLLVWTFTTVWSTFAPPLAAMTGVIAFALLTWPFFAWWGIVWMWRGRVERYQRVRAAALRARQGGAAGPDDVVAFFGPPFPEEAYRGGLYIMLLVDSVLLLAGGLTTVAVGFGQVENWDTSWLAVAVGGVMIAASPVLFHLGLRIGIRAAGEKVRSHVTWRAIAGDYS